MGEGGSWGTYHVRVGRGVLPKVAKISQSVQDGVIFHCANSGKGPKYTCLEKGPSLSGNGLLSYRCLELESRISANDAVNDVSPHRRMKSALQM